MNPIHSVLSSPEARRAFAARDIGTVYRMLKQAGVTQHEIARATGQSQSQVHDILHGERIVKQYDVFVRIADGLGVPGEWLGVLRESDGAYAEPGTVADPYEGMSEHMQRRTAVGTLAFAVFGTPLLGFGEQLAELGLPVEESLPTRLTMNHVRVVQAATEHLRTMARQFGGMADQFGASARQYTRWLAASGDDTVKAALEAALSELHTEAGWCGYDSGVGGLGYFTRAIRLADQAGDGYGIANAAWHAGATMSHSGHPDDALKCFQIGQVQLAGSSPGKSRPATLRTDDPRVPTVTGRLDISSAAAYALVDDPARARNCLAQAQESWQPRDVFDRADKDLTTARIQTYLGNLDTAEPFAQSAVRTFSDAHGRERAVADIVLAELHVRVGEPQGFTLAANAIRRVALLHSAPARTHWLNRLVAALDARPGSDARELARHARRVAAA